MRPLLLRLSAAAALMSGVAAATPPVQQSYQINLGIGQPPAPLGVFGWINESDTTVATTGSPHPVSQSEPLPVQCISGCAGNGAAGSGTDASANSPSATTTLVSGTVAHAGQLYCQNQSPATVQLILNPTAAHPTTILIDPGAGANHQGGDWQAAENMPWFLGSFVLAGAAGSQAACNYN